MQASRSRPTYQTIAPDRLRRRDLLLLGKDAALPSLALSGGAACWALDRDFPSPEEMACALSEYLKHAQVGQRLFIRGSEAFLWKMAHVGIACGLQDSDIRMEVCGMVEKPVICIACKAVSICREADDEAVECKCGLQLRIGDHFSRRLGAYLGLPQSAPPTSRPMSRDSQET